MTTPCEGCRDVDEANLEALAGDETCLECGRSLSQPASDDVEQVLGEPSPSFEISPSRLTASMGSGKSTKLEAVLQNINSNCKRYTRNILSLLLDE